MMPPFETAFDVSLLSLPPLCFRQAAADGLRTPDKKRLCPDAVVEISADRMPSAHFVLGYKRQWTPKVLASAVAQIQKQARQSGLLPLIVVPYLAEEQLLDLEKQGISGVDLCGNGIIAVPGKYTVFRTGKSNRFKSSASIKNIYRGATSLVARAFFLQPTFESVNALTDFIAARGVAISRATVSKALQGMEDDLVIAREKGILRALQPEKLLSLLEKNFLPAHTTREIVGRCPLPLPQLRQALAQKAGGGSIAATGVSSAPRYAALALEEEVALYCRDAAWLLADLPFEEIQRFPNLRLIETSDATVFFDTRRDAHGFPWASPLQSYLEMASGEPRLKQSAAAVRGAFLSGAAPEEKP